MAQHKKHKIHIQLDKLSKSIAGDISVFLPFNCAIYRHSFTVIKGPSGCGKTTLLRIIAGLDKPSAGTVVLYGDNASTSHKILIPAYKRSVGFLFQDLALWPHMKGSDQLHFVWKSSKDSRKEYVTVRNKLLNDIGLPEKLLDRYPHQLSRGQQQRLAIARSMIASPALLLLDEPFTGLDHNLRSMLVRFLVKIHKASSTTILLVTHDLFQDLIEPDQVLLYKKNTFVEH